MQQSVHSGVEANPVQTLGLWKSPAAYLTLPKIRIPCRKVLTRGTLPEISAVLHELSKRIPISGILRSKKSPLEILKHAMEKWFESFMDKEIDPLIDTDVDVFQAKDEIMHANYRDTLEDDIWILRFHCLSVNYRDFDLSKCLQKYEAEHPGLGSYILHLIGKAGYEIGTPGYIRSIASHVIWGGYENELEFVNDNYADEEDREDILEHMEVTAKEYDAAFPAWALNTQKEYRKKLPSELTELAAFSAEKRNFRFVEYSSDSIPSVLLWEDSQDVMEITLMSHENNCMEGDEDFQIQGCYWKLPIYDQKLLRKTLNEIEKYLTDFYRLLGIIRKLKKDEKNEHHCISPEAVVAGGGNRHLCQ